MRTGSRGRGRRGDGRLGAVMMTALLLVAAFAATVPAGAVGQAQGRPIVHIEKPHSSYPFLKVKGTVNISGTASDPDGIDDIVSVTVSIWPLSSWGKPVIGPDEVTGKANWYYLWDTTGVVDGDYTVSAKAVDKEAYSTETHTNYTVNNTGGPPPVLNHPPEIDIRVPSENILSGDIKARGSGDDVDDFDEPGGRVTRVEVRIDDGPWSRAYHEERWTSHFEWEYVFDSRLLTNGTHTISARAYDGIDHSEVVSDVFHCDNSPPDKGPDLPLGPLWGGGVEIVDVVHWSNPVLADMDGDGDHDILASTVSDILYYYENIGNVREPLWGISVMDLPKYMPQRNLSSVVDLDGDGDQDIVFLGQGSHTLELARNLGPRPSPRWAENETLLYDQGLSDTSRFSFGDIDDDGDLDLVAVFGYGWHFYRNTGSGSNPVFKREDAVVQGLPLPAERTDVALADLDGDGDLDLSATYFDDGAKGTIHHFRNDGTTSPEWNMDGNMFADIADGDYSSLSFADLDDDGDLDLVLYSNNNKLLLVENTGTRTSPAWTRSEDPLYGMRAEWGRHPVSYDLDDDGDIDLFLPAVDPEARSITTYQYHENVGNATEPLFEHRPGYNSTLPHDGDITHLAFADLDGNGTEEVIVLWKTPYREGVLNDGQSLGFYVNSGNSSVPNWTDWPLTYPGNRDYPACKKVLFHDMDGDGDLDMILVHSSTGADLVRNLGSRTSPLWEKEFTDLPLVAGGNPAGLEVAQIDGYGGKDFIGFSGGFVATFRGIDSYYTDHRYFLNFTFSDRPGFTACDIDGDGDEDLLMNNYYSSLKVVYNLGKAFNGPTASPGTTAVVPGEEVRFDARAFLGPEHLGPGFEYSWDFGDGEGEGWSPDTTAFHAYSGTGEHAVLLEARNSTISLSRQGTVVVDALPPEPPAAIMDIPYAIDEGETATLSAWPSYDPDGKVVRCVWSIGEEVHEGRTHEHAFWEMHDPKVTLTVFDDTGLNSTVSRSVRIFHNPAWKVGPTAVIDGPTEGEVNETLRYSCASSSPQVPGTWVEVCNWHVSYNPWTEGEEFNITFDSIGNYDIQLTVWDNRGWYNFTTMQVTITDPSELPFYPVPVVLGPEWGLVNETLNFSAALSFILIEGSYLVAFHWDFGDGNTSKGVEVGHSYNRTGNYTLTLEIVDDRGRRGSTNLTVVILDEPPPLPPTNGGTDAGGDGPPDSEGLLTVTTLVLVVLVLMAVAYQLTRHPRRRAGRGAGRPGRRGRRPRPRGRRQEEE